MRNIDRVVSNNRDAGGTFFERRTILRFKDKVLPTMYGEKFFISYALTDDGKRYTVRKVLGNGLIGHVGELHAYATKSGAREAIRLLLAGVVTA